GGSRRALIKGLLGIGGAAVVGTVATHDGEAARRPTPTPKPISCPGQQQWNGAACVCPAGTDKCGPDCCPWGEATCCGNACCYGQCYGEEVCCPSPTIYCDRKLPSLGVLHG
ncbi:MAG: hypothetical protein KC438_15065, partial [Thermomicrobiales bacterium]|nr:hypothetical protein [Thermomicrobiales bacterium]